MKVDDVREFVDQANNLNSFRWSGYDLDQVPCDHEYVKNTFDHEELLYRYACQAFDSGTPDNILRLLLRWLPSAFILAHRITLDGDMTFMLAYDVYKMSADDYPVIKRFKARPGKFMAKLGRGNEFCQNFSQEWAESIVPLKNELSQYKVRVLRSTEQIVDAYMGFSGDLDSCLCYEVERYNTEGIHPAVVYGDESNVHMAIVSRKGSSGDERDISRTLIYDKKFVKIYPPNDTNICQTTKFLLKDRGIAYANTDMDGAKLNLVYTSVGHVVCPYLDGKPYVEIDNEVGLGVKPRRFLLVGDDGFDTTQSSYYEVAAFDPSTGRIAEEASHCCEQCNADVFNDDESSLFNAFWDNSEIYVFCSEDCRSEFGYVYAYLNQYDQGWVLGEDCLFYKDEWYYDDAYEAFDLVLTDEGDLEPKDECMNLGNAWFLVSDLTAELLLCMSKLYPNDDYITEMYELYKEKEL